MKTLWVALCTALLAVASSASMGQTSPGDMKVDVPFSFVVEGQTLPAGHYIVKNSDEAHIRIVGSNPPGVYVATHAAVRSASDGSKLVFHRYGDTYFLSAVWVTGNTSGRELFRSPAERELARNKAAEELAEVRPSK
jgi:hypothetical protein